MPTDRKEYSQIIDYHSKGFAKLRSDWPRIVEEVNRHNRDGEFITFSSYEWHSLEYGDHNLYFPGEDAPLLEASDINGLHAICEEFNAFVIPHHIGYPKGLRGVNWDVFSETHSPFVEIFSMHGCAESDSGPYPYLHDMGPRTTQSTAVGGLNAGHKFGFIGSTDNHAGYPGHYGGGRAAVYADELTRESLWEAFQKRRVYAVTGDRILVKLWVNDGFMGEVFADSTSPREIEVDILASDRIDYVEVVKNGKRLQRGADVEARRLSPDASGVVRAKLRIEWGWGDKHRPIQWRGDFQLADGRIIDVEPCFRGASSLSPEELERLGDDLPWNRIASREERGVIWESITLGNPSLLDPSTNALVFEIEAPLNTPVELRINGKTLSTSVRKLLEGSVVSPMRGWLSESVCIHRAVLQEEYCFHWVFQDIPEAVTDYYYIRVAQKNGNWAWSSPIWVSR
ncbi:MAG: DUF3604 domain-containing protein [Firmicutes bacterium]|nr:DUF3604 domain-containing protein [Bacillota bacterium]